MGQGLDGIGQELLRRFDPRLDIALQHLHDIRYPAQHRLILPLQGLQPFLLLLQFLQLQMFRLRGAIRSGGDALGGMDETL